LSRRRTSEKLAGMKASATFKKQKGGRYLGIVAERSRVLEVMVADRLGRRSLRDDGMARRRTAEKLAGMKASATLKK